MSFLEILRIASAPTTGLGLSGLLACFYWRLSEAYQGTSLKGEVAGEFETELVKAAKDVTRPEQVQVLEASTRAHARSLETVEKLFSKAGTKRQLEQQRRSKLAVFMITSAVFTILGIVGLFVPPTRSVPPGVVSVPSKEVGVDFPSPPPSEDGVRPTPSNPVEVQETKRLDSPKWTVEGDAIRVGGRLWIQTSERTAYRGVARLVQAANSRLGASDAQWRLPTRRELKELIALARSGALTHAENDWIWSAEESRQGAWAWQYRGSAPAREQELLKDAAAYVRLVRDTVAEE